MAITFLPKGKKRKKEGNGHTEKSTDPTIVARATTYSGKVVRIVHVFSDEGEAAKAEHCKQKRKKR